MEFPQASTIIEFTKKYKYFLLILAAAIFLRIFKFQDFAMFGHDSSRDVILTHKMFELGEIIYRGPVFSVIWGNMSPIYYYLLAPFHFILNFHPLSSAITSHIFNFLALIFAIFASYKFFGKKAALITAIIFAVSTLLIVNTSSGLNPSFSPIFAVGLYYFLARLVIDKDKKSLIGLSVCLSFILALHMSGAFFLPFLFIIFVVKKPKTDKKTFLISLILFGLLFILPFLIQEKKLAWWTIKQFIEYFNNGADRESYTLVEKFSNFFGSLLRNTSLFLFGSIVKNHIFYTLPIYLYLGFDFIKSAINYKKLTYESLLVLLLGFYLITFMFAVPFDEDAMNRLWFGACFIPLFGIYFGLLISKLISKKFYYSGILILLIFVFVNLRYIYNYNGISDSYSNRKEIAEYLRTNSNGEDFDIYGSNPEPLYYILWYFESDPTRKEEFRKWFVWTKERGDADLIYLISNEENSSEDEDFGTQEDVYTTSRGYKIVKFRK